jgi:hypothetical protein
MARALPRLLLPILMIAAACSPAGNGAAAEARNDTAQQAIAAPGPDTAQARVAVLRLEEELFQSFARGDTAPARGSDPRGGLSGRQRGRPP